MTDPRIERMVRELLERSHLPVGIASLPARHEGVRSARRPRRSKAEAFEVHRGHLDEDAHLIAPGVQARVKTGEQVSVDGADTVMGRRPYAGIPERASC